MQNIPGCKQYAKIKCIFCTSEITCQQERTGCWKITNFVSHLKNIHQVNYPVTMPKQNALNCPVPHKMQKASSSFASELNNSVNKQNSIESTTSSFQDYSSPFSNQNDFVASSEAGNMEALETLNNSKSGLDEQEIFEYVDYETADEAITGPYEEDWSTITTGEQLISNHDSNSERIS